METQSIIESMPPPVNPSDTSIENDEGLDLSVLFPPEKSTTPDFVWEISSILADMHKDREAIKEYSLELSRKLDEQKALFDAQSEEKKEEMQRCLEINRQKEEEWTKEINALRSNSELLKSLNDCSSVYFTDMIEKIIDIIAGGKELLASLKHNEKDEANVGSVENVVTVRIDDTDEENDLNENTEEVHPPTGIEHTQPSHVSKDDLNITEDESMHNNEKENVHQMPIDGNGISIEAVQTVGSQIGKSARTSVWCKWCEVVVPKKLWSKHKWDVHKVPHKEKSSFKKVRTLKRKNDDDQSESDVSISSVVRPSLAPILQAIVKPKKPKNMATSSPV